MLDSVLDRARRRRELPDGELARMIRRRAGLTLADVGAVLGVSHVAVLFWERGRHRPRDPKLAAAYSNLMGRLAREVGAAETQQ